MKGKKWEIAVLLSDEGFGGIQFLNSSPAACSVAMAVLPKLRPFFRNLDEIIKKIKQEGTGNES